MRAAGLIAMLAPAACVRPPGEAVCPVIPEGALVVTEVRSARAPEDAEGAWIELYNASRGAIDLAGIQLGFRPLDKDTAVASVLVRRSLLAAPGSYTVLGLFDDGAPPPHVDYGFLGDYEGGWLARGAVQVETCGTLVDKAKYDAPAMGTFSLGGAPDAKRNDLDASWCVDATQVGATFPGTPKRPNIPCP